MDPLSFVGLGAAVFSQYQKSQADSSLLAANAELSAAKVQIAQYTNAAMNEAILMKRAEALMATAGSIKSQLDATIVAINSVTAKLSIIEDYISELTDE